MRLAAAACAAAALALAGCGGPVELDGPRYADSFERPSGWPDTARIGVEDGRLRLRAEARREVVYGALPAFTTDVRNMVVEADVQITRGTVAGAGVTCRAGSDLRSPELYAFIVTAEGFAQLLRADRRGITGLAGGRVPGGGAAVRRGVRLQARCLRGRLTGLVDGREVVEARDRGVRQGRAGVVLLAGDDPGAEAVFDDYVVRTAA